MATHPTNKLASNKPNHPATKLNAPATKVESGNFDDVFTGLDDALRALRVLFPEHLTPAERRRLMGAGTKRYGFIDRTMDYAEEYPQFAPGYYSQADLVQNKTDIEQLRDLQIIAEQITRLISGALLICGNRAYNLALMYYGSVRELSNRNVPGALEIYQKLKQAYLRSRSQNGEDEPTEEEIEEDVRALLHGKKDGEIVIKNERPHLVGGKREVIDEVHKERVVAKEVREVDE